MVEPRRIALPSGEQVSAMVALPAAFQPGRHPAVVLAHGAGSDMTSPFLSRLHTALADAGYVAVKFNFLYRERGRRVPDARPLLERCYRAVLDAIVADEGLRPPWVAIGGRSMGGRIASHLAAEGAAVRALLLLGYPLHPAGRPDRLRSEHLPAIGVPALFVQGTRDALADLALLRPILAGMPRATLLAVDDADHSFTVRRSSGRTTDAVWAEIVAAVVRWLGELDG